MAPTALTRSAAADQLQPLDDAQTLRASTALLRKLQTEQVAQKTSASKPSLLDDADDEDPSDDAPVWLILTTKKHVVDQKRLKPGKIVLPHPYLNSTDDNLRICLITADPQRTYKDLIAESTFPLELSKHIGRVIGITKLKAKYKSYEARRQLFGEYDVFLADDRIITYLPQVLGKVFYKSGAKRPIPITLEGKRQAFDEQGNKRRKLSEGGTKAIKSAVQPADVAREIERTLGSALVHLAPSTTTAVKVGKSSQTPQAVQANITAVVEGLVERYVPQKWRNVRAIHIKGPNTVALPIWLADELWTEETDVLDEAPPVKETKKRKRAAAALLSSAAPTDTVEVIQVPGPDGKMRLLENPASVPQREKSKKRTSSATEKSSDPNVADTRAKLDEEKLEKAARKEALKQQKAAAKAVSNGIAKDEVALKTRKKSTALTVN